MSSYLAAYSIQANFVRRTGADHPVEALAAATTASAAMGLRFVTAVALDGAEVPVEETSAWWRAQLDRGDELERRFGGLVLTTDDATAPVSAAYNVELFGPSARARLRVDLPATHDAARLAGWLGQVAVAFAADAAWVHTHDLLALVRGGSTPASERPTWWADLAPEVGATFAALAPVAQLDPCLVPEAVWWMNVWSAATIDLLGADALDVGWHQTRELEGGRMLLVACPARPDAAHPEAIARVAELVRAVELPRHQRASSPSA